MSRHRGPPCTLPAMALELGCEGLVVLLLERIDRHSGSGQLAFVPRHEVCQSVAEVGWRNLARLRSGRGLAELIGARARSCGRIIVDAVCRTASLAIFPPRSENLCGVWKWTPLMRST